MDFLNSTKGYSMSDDEATALLLDNFDIVCEIANPLLCEIANKNGISITPSMFPKILNNITHDGKVHLIDDKSTYADFIKSLGVVDDADEIELTEKACEKILPESKEAIAEVRETLNTMEQKLNDSLYGLFKICCLCTDYKNKLMWSHYADSHKGICIEYDFSEYHANKNQPMPVYYSKTRPKFPWHAAIESSLETQSEAIVHFMKALLTKDKTWSYENEWRLIMQSKAGVDKIPAPPIKCIYLGALCSPNNTDKIIKAAKKLNIQVKRMTIDRGEYELHAVEI